MLKNFLLATTFIASISNAYASQVQLEQLGGLGANVRAALGLTLNSPLGLTQLDSGGLLPAAYFRALNGDCTSMAGTVTLNCTKTGGVAFGSLATLNAAPAGTLTGTTLAGGITTKIPTSVRRAGTLRPDGWALG